MVKHLRSSDGEHRVDSARMVTGSLNPKNCGPEMRVPSPFFTHTFVHGCVGESPACDSPVATSVTTKDGPHSPASIRISHSLPKCVFRAR